MSETSGSQGATGPPEPSARFRTDGGSPAVPAITEGQARVWGTGTMPSAEGSLQQQTVVAEELLNEIREEGFFKNLARSLPEGSAQRRAVEVFARSWVLQVVGAALLYLGLALGFRILIDPDVAVYGQVNFLLYLYLLVTAVYFGKFDLGRALGAAVAMVVVAVFAFAFKLTGFRPTLYYLATHPLLTLVANLTYEGYLTDAARQRSMGDAARRELMALEGRRRTAGQQDEDILRRMKEAEDKTVQQKTHFSDLLNTLRDLGGSIRERDIYETMFRLLQRGVGVQVGEVWFLSDDESQLKVEEARTAGGRGMLVSEFDMVLPNDETSLISYAARRGQAVFPEQIEADGLLQGLARRSPHPTAFCLPVLIDGKTRAVINASRCTVTEIEPHQAALLRAVSQVASKAFESARTFLLSEKEREAAVNLSEKERTERIKTRETLERFVSANVIEEVMENPNLSQSMEVSILLADLRGFTNLSEKLQPDTVVEMLNDYFGCLTPVIFKYRGTLDKYIGDMVMALFGPPRPTGRDAEGAVRCAIEMRVAFDRQFKSKWEPLVKTKLEMGIAINTGKATVGLLGSDKQVNYTAIGDSVNIAARLEDVTPGGRVLITEATYQRVAQLVEARLVGAKSFKGKTERTKIFEIRGLKQGVPAQPPTGGGPGVTPTESADAAPGGEPVRLAAPAAAPGSGSPTFSQSGQTPTARPPPEAGGNGAPCPLCQAEVPPGSQLCPTRGMKL